MNEINEELQRQITEHSARAFKLFDEAKSIQNRITVLPLHERKKAMNKIYELQNEAIAESQKSIALEKELP